VQVFFFLAKKQQQQQPRNTAGTSQQWDANELCPAAHLGVFAHGQPGEVTQQTAQVLFKQTGVGQVLSRQVHKLVGVHHLAWRREQVKWLKARFRDNDALNEMRVRRLLPAAMPRTSIQTVLYKERICRLWIQTLGTTRTRQRIVLRDL